MCPIAIAVAVAVAILPLLLCVACVHVPQVSVRVTFFFVRISGDSVGGGGRDGAIVARLQELVQAGAGGGLLKLSGLSLDASELGALVSCGVGCRV
jgi:hypothetical protein